MDHTQIRASRVEVFGNPRHDVRYLDLWRPAPTNYAPGQALGPNQHTDRYEVVLGHDSSGELFRLAADRLMRYQIYPPDIMVATSDASVADRWLRIGDRIVQRVRLLVILGLPIGNQLDQINIRGDA